MTCSRFLTILEQQSVTQTRIIKCFISPVSKDSLPPFWFSPNKHCFWLPMRSFMQMRHPPGKDGWSQGWRAKKKSYSVAPSQALMKPIFQALTFNETPSLDLIKCIVGERKERKRHSPYRSCCITIFEAASAEINDFLQPQIHFFLFDESWRTEIWI